MFKQLITIQIIMYLAIGCQRKDLKEYVAIIPHEVKVYRIILVESPGDIRILKNINIDSSIYVIIVKSKNNFKITEVLIKQFDSSKNRFLTCIPYSLGTDKCNLDVFQIEDGRFEINDSPFKYRFWLFYLGRKNESYQYQSDVINNQTEKYIYSINDSLLKNVAN
jgi:hypothetical protein